MGSSVKVMIIYFNDLIINISHWEGTSIVAPLSSKGSLKKPAEGGYLVRFLPLADHSGGAGYNCFDFSCHFDGSG